ncbi:MAG: (2Fe-2S) ferredoxin domain-containing protein [Bacillota bacterium]
MVTVQICVGSSCFLRGAPRIIDKLQELVAAYELSNQLTLKGSFCMEQCTKGGVTVRIGDELLTGVKCEDLSGLFETKILPAVRR